MNIDVRLNPEAAEVAICAPGQTVILTGAYAIQGVRDRLTQHLITIAERGLSPDEQEEAMPDPGDPWPRHAWHSEPIPGPGAGGSV